MDAPPDERPGPARGSGETQLDCTLIPTAPVVKEPSDEEIAKCEAAAAFLADIAVAVEAGNEDTVKTWCPCADNEREYKLAADTLRRAARLMDSIGDRGRVGIYYQDGDQPIGSGEGATCECTLLGMTPTGKAIAYDYHTLVQVRPSSIWWPEDWQ